MTTPTDQAISALEFYANRYTWDSTKQRTNITAADVDRGERARDALTALRAPVAGDWVCVPREATDEAVDYGAHQIFFYSAGSKNIEDRNLVRQIYAVMTSVGTPIAAQPPAAGGMKDGDLYDLADRCGLLNKDGFRVVHRDDLVRAFRNLLATQPEARPVSVEANLAINESEAGQVAMRVTRECVRGPVMTNVTQAAVIIQAYGDRIRAETLEEAARECDRIHRGIVYTVPKPNECAASIRSLKPTGTP